MLFGHGDDFYQAKTKVRINYSSNVWYGANTAALQKHLADSMQILERYPEPDAGSLRELIAEKNNLHRGQLLVTNGSITAFYLMAHDIYRYPNLVIIQSISKLHKIPGIRIGYIAARETIIQRLEPYLIPWSVNALAIETGKYVLTHEEQFPLPLTQWLSDAQNLQEGIRQIGIDVVPSALPFFLCRLPEGLRASSLKSYLLEKEGILIRDASNFRLLDARYFRLSTQRPAENRLLLDALKRFLVENRRL